MILETESNDEAYEMFTAYCDYQGIDEDEQLAEHVKVVGDEVQVVVEDDFVHRHLVLVEVIEFLRKVKYNGNA